MLNFECRMGKQGARELIWLSNLEPVKQKEEITGLRVGVGLWAFDSWAV